MSNKNNSKENRDKNPIDPDQAAKYPGLLPYAHNVGGVPVKPEDKGKIKGRAVAAMNEQTGRQMDQLKGQAAKLAEQAQALNRRVEVSERIYNADINFEPIPGKEYFLYQKEDDTDLLSMIAPDEWGRKKPFSKFTACVRLMADHTWEIIEYNEE